MTRAQLEHIIRAAGTIADVEDLIVIGSQAVLGEFPDAPPELLVSHEADVYPPLHPERSDLIDATIGEGSPFESPSAIMRTALRKLRQSCLAAGAIV
jgi:hypothetical protein